MRRAILAIALAAILLIGMSARAEEMDGDMVYTLQDASGKPLTMRAGRMYVGDEYISSDDQLYRVVRVDDQAGVATAEHLGEAVVNQAAATAFHSLVAQAEASKLVAMYSTHSDESYEPTDGTSSKMEDAGIYDVGNALKDALEEHGIEVIYSEDTFHPHDSAAYTRSKRTAEELLQKGPDALFDIHRDAVPAEQYETTIDGEETSKVRLFVGRSNPNGDANRAFAQELKAAADEEYPGLIKDIYVGKGNYNQELYPRALLLEMGTHTIDKDLAVNATDYMADVISETLYGPSAKAAESAETKGAGKGILWVIGGVIVAAVVYALVASGSFKRVWHKIKRSTSEVTGGIVGEKPEKPRK